MALRTYIEKIRLEIMFIPLAIVFGLAIIFITPPFQAADEHSHFSRAYQVSEGTWIAEKHLFSANDPVPPYEYGVEQHVVNGVASGGYLPLSIAITFEKTAKGIEHDPRKKYDPQKTFALLNLPLMEHARIFHHFANTAVYSPVPYLPQAFGIAFGRLLDLSPLCLMYLGRICNLLCWIFLTFFSIKMMPVQRRLLFVIALMPMTLFQGSSLSADAVTNGVCFLLIALFMRGLSEAKPIIIKQYLLILFLSLALALCKMAYFPIILLVTLLPVACFGSIRRYLAAVSTVIVSSLLVNFWWYTVADSLYLTYTPGSSSTEQLSFLKSEPFAIIIVIYNTLHRYGILLFQEFVGILGWLDTIFPSWFYAAYLIMLLFMLLSDKERTWALNIKARALVALTCILSSLLVFVSVYLYYTPVQLSYMVLQGRYFTPIIPLFFLVLSRRKSLINVRYPQCLLLSFVIFSSFFTVLTIIQRYYISG